jgi:hypothetical protein
MPAWEIALLALIGVALFAGLYPAMRGRTDDRSGGEP